MAEFIAISDAMKESQLSHVQIAKLARKGKIKARRTGRFWLVDPDSLREHEERMKALGTAKHHPHPDK